MKKNVLLVLIFCASCGLYFRAKDHYFLFLDDSIHVFQNPLVNPPSVEGLRKIWREPNQGLYIPVTYSLWALESELALDYGTKTRWGHPDPRFFHVPNILIHAANSVLVALILILLFKNLPAAAVGALLFAWHPVHVEAVAWVSGLKDVLSSFFALLSTYLYLSFCVTQSSKRARIRYGFALFTYGLALLSKPSQIALPLVLICLEVGFLKGVLRTSLLRLVPWFGLSLADIAVTRTLQLDLTMPVLSWVSKLAVAFDALIFYLTKLLLPLHLIPDYGRSPDKVLLDGWLAPLLTVTVVVSCLSLLPRPRFWWSLIGIFVAGVIPVLGIQAFLFQNFSTVTDRYLYLSVLTLSVGAAYCLTHLSSKVWRAGFFAMLFLFAILTFRQVDIWKDSQTLFAYTLEKNPESAIAHDNYGLYLEWKGNRIAAIDHLRFAVRTKPNWLQFRYDLAKALLKSEQWKEAAVEVGAILEKNPSDTTLPYYLGLALASSGQPRKAIEPLKKAIRDAPTESAAELLTEILNKAERYDEAIAVYEATAFRFPMDGDLILAWGTSLEAKGRGKEATQLFERSLERDPDNEKMRLRLGETWMKQGETVKAINLYERWLSHSPNDPKLHLLLAQALHRAGKLEESKKHFLAAQAASR